LRLITYILLLVFPLTLSAQKVKWENTTVNFGAVRDWNSPPATFTFQNTGKEKLMFLPQRHDREVLVRYPNRAIRPGETGAITIFYYTGETGSFYRTVEVYSNASNQAVKLTVKGNVKSIYADALTSCPSFQTTTPKKSGEPNVIQVVDAKTHRSIPGAQVEVFDRGIRKTINGTNLEGVAVNWVEPGKYIAVAYKEGYEKWEEEVAFTKRNRSHVLYLNRKANQSELLDEAEILVSVDNRWEEPEVIVETGEQIVEVEEPFDLGITTNEVLAEEEFDLGITTNDRWEEAVEPIKEIEEPFDLGITTNELLSEEPAEPVFVQEDVPARTKEELDLGIATNNQFEEKEEVLEPTEAEIERTVEEALTNAEAEEVADEVFIELEPELEPEFSSSRYKPNNVLLLLDVSGSMKDEDKMVKLKASIRRLVMMLREVDVLTMIAYNSTSWELLPPTPVVDNQAIIALIDSLQPYGYTNGVKGMESAYASLQSQLISGGNNQLIIATDGKFNSSKFSEKDAIELVKSNSDKGIVLSIIGFGEDKEAGRLMKKLAGLGEGSFLQVKNNEDPTEVLAEEIKSRSRKL
jgi:Mg-chelatase subunit ChlD